MVKSPQKPLFEESPALGSREVSRPPIDVRAVRFGDLPGLRRFNRFVRLEQPDAQLRPYSPLRSGLAASFPGGRTRRPVFVAVARGRLVGFAEFCPVYSDQRWLLIAIGGPPAEDDAEPVWEALLREGVRGAGLRGSRRLFARLSETSPIIPSLRRVGWTPYASETIFSAEDVRATGSSTILRPQRPADTWAIHQLYNLEVPRAVQDAEALTSHHWDVRPGSSPGGVRSTGWLLEEGHQLLGYARITSRVTTHVLELVHHPARRDALDDLIRGALAVLPKRTRGRVHCPIRSYQAEVASRLEDHGFSPILEQELHVKYTTAYVRLPALDVVPFHAEVRDKAPQRVPTFCRGRAGDGSPG